jgi:hypothetical protein
LDPNTNFFSLIRIPKLQYSLLISTSATVQRRSWQYVVVPAYSPMV